jgi:hypothetical protein
VEPEPTALPHDIIIDGIADLVSTPGSVAFSGFGTIQSVDSQGATVPFSLGSVTIKPGANITARKLEIVHVIELEGNGTLSADDDDHISLVQNLSIVIRSVDGEYPFFDLGMIGTQYDFVPSAIIIANANPSPGSVYWLISGATLTNCEEWRSVVTFEDSEGVSTECKKDDTGEKVALALRGKADAPSDDGVNVGLIAGATVGCVALIAGIGGVAAWKKKQGGIQQMS